MFSVVVYHRDGLLAGADRVVVTEGLDLAVRGFSFAAQGGPDKCEVGISGDPVGLRACAGWLRHRIEVVSDEGALVWWGYVDSVDLPAGAVSVGIGLDWMANRVAVRYPMLQPGGRAGGYQQSAWAEDAVSVAAYGRIERVVSHEGALTSTQADGVRDLLLAQLRLPQPYVREAKASPSATVHCLGWWHTLGWEYCERLRGRCDFAELGAGQQSVGKGFDGTGSVFAEAAPGRVYDVLGRWRRFQEGEEFAIAGSAGIDGVWTVKTVSARAPFSVYSGEVRFDTLAGGADGWGLIGDSHGLYKGLWTGDRIEITGSDHNDGFYRIALYQKDGEEMFVFPPPAVTELDACTLNRGNYVETWEAVADEDPGAATQVYCGEKVAQQFQWQKAGDLESWDVTSVAVRIKKVGSPADNVRVGIWSSLNQKPHAELGYGVISAAQVGPQMGWVEADLVAPVSINNHEWFWVMVSRAGAPDWNDFYAVDVNENCVYAGSEAGLGAGGCKWWDSMAWQARLPACDMAFRLRGVQDTCLQAQAMLGRWQFSGGVVVDLLAAESYLASNPWRAGDARLLRELEEVLDFGIDYPQGAEGSGSRLLVVISAQREAIISVQPILGDNVPGYAVASAPGYLLADGRVLAATGVEVAPGESVAGRWLVVDVGLIGDVDADGAASPFFVERCEVDGATGKISVFGRDPRRRVGELVEGAGAAGVPAVADLARLLRPHVAGLVDSGG